MADPQYPTAAGAKSVDSRFSEADPHAGTQFSEGNGMAGLTTLDARWPVADPDNDPGDTSDRAAGSPQFGVLPPNSAPVSTDLPGGVTPTPNPLNKRPGVSEASLRSPTVG